MLIVDGTLVATCDHSVAVHSKNYRYSTNHRVVIDADSRLVVTVGRPMPGSRNDCKAWELSGAKGAVGSTTMIADGGYRGTGRAMAGLLWITPVTVYLGAPPSTTPSAVSLAPDGLTAVGPQAGSWSWPHVTSVTVGDVPSRTTAGRSFSRVPNEMTVRVETTEGPRFGIAVHSPAASGYTVREVELPQRLLEHFVQGEVSPALLTDWLMNCRRSRAPRTAEREALLQPWTETL
ncbi:hypothetical protein SCANM124S_00281 [Streptomyces canus]